MRVSFFWLMVSLAVTVVADPTDQHNSCAVQCTKPETFSYEIGKSYVYDYSVTTSTTLLGTIDDNAQLRIKAKAHIAVASSCDYILKLTNVHLEGSTHEAEFSDAISKESLRFSFQDGRVETLCTAVAEPNWVLNFKRGVLSTFQNSMKYSYQKLVNEIDISGLCTTRYDVTTEGDLMSVERVKDLSSCTRGPDMDTYLRSTSYTNDSPVQGLPLFESTNQCIQQIKGGVLKDAECKEIHKFRPFSTEEGGAVTHIKTTMTLVSHAQSYDITKDFQFNRTTLVFAHDTSTNLKPKPDVVEHILNDLEAASRKQITSDIPVLFSHLVASLKRFDYLELTDIYDKCHEPHNKKFLRDAITLLGTAGSAGLVRDMIMNKELTETEADLWFISLTFLKNPDPDILNAIAPLLDESSSQKTMLGTSALVNNYCKVQPDCESNKGFIEVMKRIEAHLGYNCHVRNMKAKNQILIALKALGNAGSWIKANSILRRCYSEEDNDVEIRIAALQAWRNTPCEYDRFDVQAAFQDETQDTEVRIAAYLALMSCPTQGTINVIKERLISEGVNHVGSFIWTHLTNLKNYVNSDQSWIYEMIGNKLLQNKFNAEALKYSRNYQSSFFMNELNVGATIGRNLIFSTESYLPRSAMLNLTLELFGKSINLFEVGGRIEGFETYVEHFFGQHGYFPEETVESVLKNMRKPKSDDHGQTALETISENMTEEPQGSYYLRVFDNEIHYHNFHGLGNIFRKSGTINPLECLIDLIRKGDINYSKSYQLFDTKYTIPTVSGLPLTLTAKGTATVNVELNGKFEAQNIQNVDIEGHFNPSAAVEVDGIMVVNAHVTKAGLKITSNLHTSTFLNGNIKINKGKLIDIAFKTPKEKIELISVQTKFFYLENDEEQETGTDKQVVYKACTKGTTGISLCGEYNYTPTSGSSPKFPLTGPIGTKIYFGKTDTHTSYIFHFEYTKNYITLIADTPDSQNNHKILMDLRKQSNAFSVDIQTPYKMVNFSGEYIWNEDNKNAKLNLAFDGEQYEAGASLMVARRNGQINSSAFITTPKGELLNLRGALHISDKSGDVSLQVKTPVFETDVKNHFGYEPNVLLTFNTDAEYKINGRKKETIRQVFSLSKQDTDQVQTYASIFEFIPTAFSNKSLIVDFESKISNSSHIASKGKLAYGPISWEGEQLWFHNYEADEWKLKDKLVLKCLYYDIDYLASVQLSSTHNNWQGLVRLVTVPGNDFLITSSFNKSEGKIVGGATTQLGDSKALLRLNYNRITFDDHEIQINTKIIDGNLLLEGNFESKSSRGKITAIADSLYKSGVYNITSNLGIYADQEKVLVDGKTHVNGLDYTVKLEGTSLSSLSTILVDIGIVDDTILNTYVTKLEEQRTFLVNTKLDAAKTFALEGKLSPTTIHLYLQFVANELVLSSKFMNADFEVEAEWIGDDTHILYNLVFNQTDTLLSSRMGLKTDLDIKTPSELPIRMGGLVNWNFEKSTKTVLAKTYIDEEEYLGELELSTDDILKGYTTTKVRTPIPGWTSVDVIGTYDFISMPYNFNFTFEKEDEVNTIYSTFNIDHNLLAAEVITTIPNWEKIMLSGDYTFQNNHLSLVTDITKNSKHYNFTSDVVFNTQTPKIYVTLNTLGLDDTNFELSFNSDLLDSDKKIFILLKMRYSVYSMKLNGQLNVNLVAEHLFPRYHDLEISTNINFTYERVISDIKFKQEGQYQHIAVDVMPRYHNILIEMQTSIKDFNILKFTTNYIAYLGEHDIHALQTPIKVLENVELRVMFEVLQAGSEGLLYFRHGSEIFELKNKIKFTSESFELTQHLQTPVIGWREMSLHIHYDMGFKKKTVEIVFKKDSNINKITLEGSYDLRGGSIKIETPIEGYRVLNIEYTLNMFIKNKQISCSLNIYKESLKWIYFVVEGEYNVNKILIKIQTPFQSFKTTGAEINMNFDAMKVEGDIEFADSMITFNISFAYDGFLFMAKSPFNSMKMISVGANYEFANNSEEVMLHFLFNTNRYVLKGALSHSPETSGITFHSALPFQSFNNMTIKAKYDLGKTDELISFLMITQAQHYALKLGGYGEENIFYLTLECTSPFPAWSNVKLTFKFNSTSEDKNIEISMEKDGNIKTISISGTVSETTLNVHLKTPFTGLNDAKQVLESLNRAKRYVGYHRTSNTGQFSFESLFNYVSIKLVSLLGATKEVRYNSYRAPNIVKYEVAFKDSFIKIHLNRPARNQPFTVDLQSELQGWEFHALSGRMDQETLCGYINGQLREDKIRISASGTASNEGSFRVSIQTPYADYKSIESELRYIKRRKEIKLKVASSSSNFLIEFEGRRNRLIKYHSILPHPNTPTEIKLHLVIDSGDVQLTSHYHFLRNFQLKYHHEENKAGFNIRWNDLEILKMSAEKWGDFEIHLGITEEDILIQLKGSQESSSFSFLVRNNDKEFRVDTKGTSTQGIFSLFVIHSLRYPLHFLSGELICDREIDIAISNSFSKVLRNIDIHISFNLCAEDKHFKVEGLPYNGELYDVDLSYSFRMPINIFKSIKSIMSLPNNMYVYYMYASICEFKLLIGSTKSSKIINGNWDLTDHSNANIEFSVDGIPHTIKGRISYEETNIAIQLGYPYSERYFLQWNFKIFHNIFDLFFKAGKLSAYGMLKLEFIHFDYKHVHINGGIKAGTFMANEFMFTSFLKNCDGIFHGRGTFSYGCYHGENTLKLTPRRGIVALEAQGTSNIPNYERITVRGNYNVNRYVSFNLVIDANDIESTIEIDLLNFSIFHHGAKIVTINIPPFDSYGNIEINVSSDFSETEKYIVLIAKLGTREESVKISWSRNDMYDKYKGNIGIQTLLIGEVNIEADIDISNIDDTQAVLTYRKTNLIGHTRTASLDWTYRKDSDNVENKLVIDKGYFTKTYIFQCRI